MPLNLLVIEQHEEYRKTQSHINITMEIHLWDYVDGCHCHFRDERYTFWDLCSLSFSSYSLSCFPLNCSIITPISVSIMNGKKCSVLLRHIRNVPVLSFHYIKSLVMWYSAHICSVFNIWDFSCVWKFSDLRIDFFFNLFSCISFYDFVRKGLVGFSILVFICIFKNSIILYRTSINREDFWKNR